MGLELLIFFLIFATLLLFGSGVYFYIQARRERIELIQRIDRAAGTTFEDPESREGSLFKQKVIGAVGKLGGFLKPRKEEEISELRRLFLRAGYKKENAPIFYFGMKSLLAILFVIAAFLGKFFIWKTIPSIQFLTLALIAALIGLFLPNIWIKFKISQRKGKVQEGLPDALDLMVVCVEAGTGLDAAINRVGEEMKLNNRVLSDEFRLLGLELRAGKTRKDALRNLAMRTDLEDINNLVTLLIQTERFGTSVAQALRVHADFMRTKRHQRAEEIAAKMPLKLIFPLVLFIFPTFLMVAAGPAIINIFRFLISR